MPSLRHVGQRLGLFSFRRSRKMNSQSGQTEGSRMNRRDGSRATVFTT